VGQGSGRKADFVAQPQDFGGILESAVNWVQENWQNSVSGQPAKFREGPMSVELRIEAQQDLAAEAPVPTKVVGERIWRFLAAVLLFSVGWILWIAYQLNPPMLVTKAAFEAAAKAKAHQNVFGVLAPKPEAEAPKAEAEAAKPEAEAPKPEPVAKEPPVNLEKLKLSESITLPLAQDAKKK